MTGPQDRPTGPPLAALSRRTLLQVGTLTAGAVAADGLTARARAFAQVVGGPRPTMVLDVALPDSQLRLRMDVYGLVLEDGQLVSRFGANPGTVVVHLGGQHTSTEVLEEGEVVPGFGSPSATANPSRLVFDVTPPVPFTLDALLDWERWGLVVDGRAAEDADSADTTLRGAAAEDVTMLELPAGIELAPLPDVRVRLDAESQTLDGVGRPWSARLGRNLGVATIFTPAAQVRLRAIHTPGYSHGSAPADTGDPFPRAVTALDRERIVQATGDWSSTALDTYPDHEPLLAGGMQLTGDGATGLLSGTWAGPGELDVYAHLLSRGRSEVVTVARSGYLLPFGHQVVVTRSSERTFAADTEGVMTSHLGFVERLIVPAGTVMLSPDLPDEGRGWPFAAVTLVPPDEAPTDAIRIPGVPLTEANLVADADGEPLQMAFVGTDRQGKPASFRCPVVFVGADEAVDPSPAGVLSDVLGWLDEPDQQELFTIPFARQPVAFAEVADPADAPLVTKEVWVMQLRTALVDADLDQATLRASGMVAFGPVMGLATIGDPVLDGITGSPDTTVEVSYSPDFLQHGLDAANYGGSLLDLTTPLSTSTAGTGAKVTSPDLSIDQFTVSLGPSATLTAEGEEWDPLESLPDSAKLIGIPLKNLLPAITFGPDPAAQTDLPSITSTAIGDTPDEFATELSLRWEPDLQSFEIAGTPTFVITEDLDADDGLDNPFQGASSAVVTITQVVAVGAEAQERTETQIEVRRVMLQVPPGKPMVQVWLDDATWTDVDGDGNLSVDVRQVAFTGPLNFLDEVEDVLNAAGVSPWLPPLEDGVIKVGVEISVPSFSIGVLTIDTFAAIIGMCIPLTDDPAAVYIALGTQAEPIHATVLGIGGEAWFELVVAGHPDGVISLSAGLAFVVELSINALIAKAYVRGSFGLEVASEQVGVLNPVTGVEDSVDQLTILARIELAAGISLLGLVEINGQIDLVLAYNVDLRLLSGSATFTFTSETLWGSKKTKSKTFEAAYPLGAGDGGPAAFAQVTSGPTRRSFGDRYDQSQWLEYGAAFA